MDGEEQGLVLQAQTGNREAVGQLYDKYIKHIYRFVYAKTFNTALAEDLTSTVFVKALERLGQFKARPDASFQAWLYQIARTTIIDHYRTLKPTEYLEDGWDLGTPTLLPNDTDNRLQLDKATAFLQTLPPHERDIILLRIWQDLPYKDIALIVGKSEKNCKVIFSRSIRKLRAAIPLSTFLLLTL